MTETRDISPTIGEGVYSVPDAARILGFPINTVRRWIKTYWEDKFTEGEGSYTWGEGRHRGFNFHTLVELIAIHALRQKDVSFHKIINARKLLQEELDTEYPFATKRVMSDGEHFYYALNKTALMDVNLTRQTSIKEVVEPYCQKLNFDSIDLLAKQFWPLGKGRSVVVDPNHRLGEPTIQDTNISVEMIGKMADAGEKINTIANLYRLKSNQVRDAIEFHKKTHVAA